MFALQTQLQARYSWGLKKRIISGIDSVLGDLSWMTRESLADTLDHVLLSRKSVDLVTLLIFSTALYRVRIDWLAPVSLRGNEHAFHSAQTSLVPGKELRVLIVRLIIQSRGGSIDSSLRLFVSSVIAD